MTTEPPTTQDLRTVAESLRATAESIRNDPSGHAGEDADAHERVAAYLDRAATQENAPTLHPADLMETILPKATAPNTDLHDRCFTILRTHGWRVLYDYLTGYKTQHENNTAETVWINALLGVLVAADTHNANPTKTRTP